MDTKIIETEVDAVEAKVDVVVAKVETKAADEPKEMTELEKLEATLESMGEATKARFSNLIAELKKAL